MSKEAMKLALEALETIAGAMPFPVGKSAITALREALAEQPARTLGELHALSRELWTEQPAQPAPVQEPVAWAMYQKGRLLSFWMDKGDAYDFEFTSEHRWEPLYTSPPAQPAPVQEPVAIALNTGTKQGVKWLKNVEHGEHLYTSPLAQPAVPDAFGTREGEHPQYIEGWNDCRAEMLKGMNT